LEASTEIVSYSIAHGVNVVVGTSGWANDRVLELKNLVEGKLDVGVAIIPNFSLGSVLGTWMATKAAKFYDAVEIVEIHHAQKKDSPSGTATRTAEAIAAAREGKPVQNGVDGPGRGVRVEDIPIHALRLPGVVAKQEIIFAGTGETLSIVHDTISPDAYKRGILQAIQATVQLSGVVVGLDALLGWDSL
ncbi:MAG: 4-hydroxy-tetrahydrodipicolinate reductase, partial [Microbacteriaceae bacterium]